MISNRFAKLDFVRVVLTPELDENCPLIYHLVHPIESLPLTHVCLA